jgi:hypothetical protein
MDEVSACDAQAGSILELLRQGLERVVFLSHDEKTDGIALQETIKRNGHTSLL